MSKTSKKKITAKYLKSIGVPGILIAGFITAHMLGWDAKALERINNYHKLRTPFLKTGIVEEILDDDTFVLKNGVTVRMIGINTPEGESSGSAYLKKKVLGNKVYLEYDRYQDDKFSRVLAWVWIDCEKSPTFLPADYMHKSNNESNEGLVENPKGCKKGKLINEELVILQYADPVTYKDRGELKYEKRINI